ncbi:MAG: hypothetical protein KAI22_03685 [Gammaproteobacteria bacterium]|nr:hypothetical protein [Gammaproteobacteria bacterium]
MSNKQTLFGLWLFLLITTVLIYSPGLNGSFEFDDIANIIVNKSLHADEFSLQTLKDIALSRSNNSGSGRPISFLSFAANINTTGLNPYYFKLTNLVIHLLNAFLVFSFIRLLLNHGQLTKNRLENNQIIYLALGVSALWLIHPIQLTSVLYIVQRMTSLSALFLLLTFIVYIKGRERSLKPLLNPSLNTSLNKYTGIPLTLSAVSALTVLAVLSKENGALAPLFLLIIEAFSFKFKTRNRLDFILLLGFFVITIALLLYFIIPGQPLSRWSVMVPGRHFSLSERLYTEITILWLYLSLILTPVSEHFSIYHDYWPLSRSLLEPLSTLISLFALLGCLFLGVVFRYKYPFFLFAVLWFLAGHLMESSFITLELVHEHRNYLPSLGILFCLVLFLYQIKNRKIFIVILLLIFSVFSWTTYVRSVQWSSEMRHAIAEVKNHPESARANYQLGRVMYYVYKKRRLEASYFSASQFFKNAIGLSQYNLNAYIGHFILDGEANKGLNKTLYHNFITRLESAPIRSPSLAYFETLSKCQMQGRCPFSHDEFMQMFRAMNNNKQMSARLRSELQRVFFDYMKWYQDKQSVNAER